MSVGDVALTSEGSILVAVTMRRAENEYASALLEYARSGDMKRIIKTDPFVVKKMALDSEGNIWVLGYDWQQMEISFDWPMIRRLSPDGVWLTSALPRSFFSEDSAPLNIAGPGVVVSDIYFDILEDRMYVWLPGVNRLITLDLAGRILQVVNEPFRRVFGDLVTSVEVISLVFMPGSGVMTQIRGYGEGGETRSGWMASSDLGRGWIRVIDRRVDPMATRLVGLTQRGEVVCLRVIRSGDVEIELAPIGF
ncbi:MAG: hypothetical protein D6723_14790 [Acidobacteria bacterium]|nr:MAG: hypothetical protein D6723_14790 [Acidobacteriota bacterium]